MTKEKLKEILNDFQNAYPKDKFTREKAELWFRLLGDLDYELVREAADNHMKRSSYSPTIADIRNACEEIIERDDRYITAMREIFNYALGIYPEARVEKDTMGYWDKLTANSSWQTRVEKAKALSSNIATFIRDSEINGQINEIPTFTDYLKGLANELRS